MLTRNKTPLLLMLLLLAACGDQPQPKPEAPAPIMQDNQLRFSLEHPQLKLLSLVAADQARPITIELPAKLVWNEEHTQRIYPPFAGRVTAIQADVGQRVDAGMPLAQLASPDFGQAQSDTARAKADTRLADKALQRQRELFEAGIVARKELDQAEAEHERARAELDRALARTRLYGGSTEVNQQLTLRAGIRGVVVERSLNPGQELRPEMAGPGVPPLFVVTDPGTLWLQIDARENEIGVLRKGQRFRLSVPALPGKAFEGRITASSDFIDPQTRTIKVRAVVANPERLLKAEMLASALFERRFDHGVVVPASAVLLNGSQHRVFIQPRPGAFEPRKVELGYQGVREVVITGGLVPGDQVVTENALLLARQFRMAQHEAPPTPAAPATQKP